MPETLQPWTAFAALLRGPSRGLRAIQARTMRPRTVILFLLGVGLVRSLLDVPWIYWQAGGLPLLVPSLGQPSWYLVNVGPYVLSVVVTALLRWVLFAALVFYLARFLGGRGSYRVTLDVYAAVLGITIFTILIDYVHLFFDVPLIRFAASPSYNPVIGVGQVVTAAWIGYVTYLLARRELRLSVLPAVMVGAFVPLLNTGLFLIAARIVFRLLPAGSSLSAWLVKLNVGFVAVCLAAFAILFWWGWRRATASVELEAAPCT